MFLYFFFSVVIKVAIPSNIIYVLSMCKIYFDLQFRFIYFFILHFFIIICQISMSSTPSSKSASEEEEEIRPKSKTQQYLDHLNDVGKNSTTTSLQQMEKIKVKMNVILIEKKRLETRIKELEEQTEKKTVRLKQERHFSLALADEIQKWPDEAVEIKQTDFTSIKKAAMQVLRILKRFSFKFDQNSYDKITQINHQQHLTINQEQAQKPKAEDPQQLDIQEQVKIEEPMPENIQCDHQDHEKQELHQQCLEEQFEAQIQQQIDDHQEQQIVSIQATLKSHIQSQLIKRLLDENLRLRMSISELTKHQSREERLLKRKIEKNIIGLNPINKSIVQIQMAIMKQQQKPSNIFKWQSLDIKLSIDQD